MSFPAGLHVVVRPPRGAAETPCREPGPSPSNDWPAATSSPPVVLVHGSLDRAESFRRVTRRLEDLPVITYDRRGYQRSRGTGPAVGLDGHVADLLAILRTVTPVGHGLPAAVVGHSLGGDVVIGAALQQPVFWAVGAYEPPIPWLGAGRDRVAEGDGARRRWSPLDDRDPEGEVERFFRRMVGDAPWERLTEHGRRQRREDGPALIADLRSIRGTAPYDVTTLEVPAVFGRGGGSSSPRHRQSVAWLAGHVPGATLVEIEHAGHGAHLSHPDAFADLVRTVIQVGDAARNTTADLGEPVRR